MTGISWTDEVWNPTTGCDRVSPGCDNCYALTMAKRLKGMGQAKYWRDGDPATSGPGFGLTAHLSALDIPLHWRKPRRVFVNSMSDLFHANVPETFIGSVWNTMALAERHTFQVLTKRHARMRSMLNRWADAGWTWRRDDMVWCGPLKRPLANVWCGTSVENQPWADIRIPALRETPAAVRFLSCEPLLGPIDFRGALTDGIGWVIVGGESGRGHRELNIDWIASIAEQCAAAGVPLWVKQDGGPKPGQQGRIPDDLWIHQFPDRAAAKAA